MSNAFPGFYPAQGDPPGTVRYWDGSQWASDPVPPPPGYRGPEAQNQARFGGAWIRMGAAVLDSLVTFVLLLPVLIPWMSDVLDQIDGNSTSEDIQRVVEDTLPRGLLIGSLIIPVIFAVMVGAFGGSPGKLIVGLRVTRDDGETSPPGLGKGFLRMIPGLLGGIPGIGVVIAIFVLVASLVWIVNDDERRSAYDRIAGTRVVYKRQLTAPTIPNEVL